ncbi:hypothetical protein G9464_02760 [Halostella sp. JP-L12]|nr:MULTISPECIES: hypothetical protein [Halostella]NHN46518.1 hypothetical protein [Halostella sp. JP-L12]
MVKEVTLEISDGHYALLEVLHEDLEEDVEAELAAIVESSIHNTHQEYFR